MTYRNLKDDVKTEGLSCLRISSEDTCLPTGWHPVLRRRELDFRLLCGTWEPVVPMIREKFKWRTHKNESTDAEHRDGSSCISEEVLVMRMERRG